MTNTHLTNQRLIAKVAGPADSGIAQAASQLICRQPRYSSLISLLQPVGNRNGTNVCVQGLEAENLLFTVCHLFPPCALFVHSEHQPDQIFEILSRWAGVTNPIAKNSIRTVNHLLRLNVFLEFYLNLFFYPPERNSYFTLTQSTTLVMNRKE